MIIVSEGGEEASDLFKALCVYLKCILTCVVFYEDESILKTGCDILKRARLQRLQQSWEM